LREFAFSKGDFEFLAGLAYKHAGISLADSKRNLVYSRLSRRLRTLGLASFSEYRRYLEDCSGDEIERFIVGRPLRYVVNPEYERARG